MSKPCEFCGKPTYPPRIAMTDGRFEIVCLELKWVVDEISYAHHACARTQIKQTIRATEIQRITSLRKQRRKELDEYLSEPQTY